MDDVLADSIFTYMDVLKKEYGKSVDYKAIHSFDLQESFDLDDKTFAVFFKRLHEDEIMFSIKPVPGSAEIVRHWSSQGYPVFIVTGRPECTRGVTEKWLKHFSVPFDELILVDKYNRDHFIKSGGCSLNDLEKMSFSLAVEDSVKMALLLSDRMKIPVALIDRPWNASLADNPLIRRYHGWHQIGKTLRSP